MASWFATWPGMPLVAAHRDPFKADHALDRKLRHAAWEGNVSAAKSLLRNGAKLEKRDGDMYTPLLIACRWGKLAMVRFLVEEAGADVRACDLEGNSGYTCAQTYHFSAVARYMASAGCPTGNASSGALPGRSAPTRQDSTDEWLGMIRDKGPSHTTDDPDNLRDRVGEGRGQIEEPAPTVEVLPERATGEQHPADGGTVLGQLLSFPVAQKLVRSAAPICRLSIGSMGLVLFDGPRPIATLLFSTIRQSEARATKASAKLTLTIAATQPDGNDKTRTVVFRTLHAQELCDLIRERVAELKLAVVAHAGNGKCGAIPDDEVHARTDFTDGQTSSYCSSSSEEQTSDEDDDNGSYLAAAVASVTHVEEGVPPKI